MHIPAIRPTRIDASVESIDLMPTVFELLEIQNRSYRFQGRSTIPLIRKSVAADNERAIISEAMDRARVRIGKFALRFSPDDNSQDELFDLSRDPLEMENIVDRHPDIVQKLKVPYFQVVAAGKGTASQFVLHRRNTINDIEALEQLKALGYVAQ